MNPKLCKRFGLSSPSSGGNHRTVSIGNENDIEKTSVRDAALLLSIAEICNSEIRTGGLANLWRDDLTLPRFPCLTYNDSKGHDQDDKILAPRTDSLRDFMSSSGTDIYDASSKPRMRSVSIEYPRAYKMEVDENDDRSLESPSFSSAPVTTPIHSPVSACHTRVRKQGLRCATMTTPRARSPDNSTSSSMKDEDLLLSPSTPRRSKELQGPCPSGLTIKRIHRKKFSWKNYPELEQFLIANREEYLRHSALNYTVQQKQYNNRLTDRLLELATENGYLFDEKEFNFVTVRDRIRCYYKSYVQSAKKRGVLMGYAARKAGLLSEDDLDAGKAGRIVTP